MSTTIRSLLFILLCICAVSVYAQDLNEQNRRKQEIERQIEVIDKQLASNEAQQQTTLRELELLQQKVASRKLLLTNIESQIKQLNDSIEKKGREIGILREEYEKIEFSYLQVLYKAYTQRNRQIWATFILSSDNLPQAYRRWQYFKNYSRYLTQQASQIKEADEVIREEIHLLRKLRTDTENLKEERQKELTTINMEERQSKLLVADLSRQEGRLRAQLQQQQRERDALDKEIARIMAEAENDRKAANPAETETSRVLAANFEQNKGQLPWPLTNGVITEPYGQHNHPELKGIKMPFNNGVGITGNQVDEVRAVFPGVVKWIGILPAYNQCVMVQHGSYYTFYCRLGAVKVKPGDDVAAGTPLGTLSEINGEFTLHFEIWNGTNKQNPEQWLKKR